MSEESFREEIRTTVRRHDPTAEELRDLAGDLEQLAERVETTNEVL
jgi:hypothetical protein